MPGMPAKELKVIDEVHQLILWSCRHIASFPRPHQFTLGERMERQLYDLLDLLLRAKYRSKRLALLNDANLELEVLRFQFRLAERQSGVEPPHSRSDKEEPQSGDV